MGEKRLATAAELAGVALELVWHAFELDPRPVSSQKTTDYVEYLGNKYGRTRQQAQGMVDQMARVGLEEGVAFDFEHAIFANTFDAHRLLKWSLDTSPERQDALARALFDAHLCEGKDLNDRSTLCSLVERVGLDVEKASALLSSDDYSGEVRQDEALAQEMGVTGVPFYVIGGYGVGGAQRPETFQRVIEKVLAEAPSSSDEAVEGAFCGPDGC